MRERERERRKRGEEKGEREREREQSQTETNWIEGCRKISGKFRRYKIGSEKTGSMSIFALHNRIGLSLRNCNENYNTNLKPGAN